MLSTGAQIEKGLIEKECITEIEIRQFEFQMASFGSLFFLGLSKYQCSVTHALSSHSCVYLFGMRLRIHFRVVQKGLFHSRLSTGPLQKCGNAVEGICAECEDEKNGQWCYYY